MNLGDYLKARGESRAAFSRRSGVPRTLVARVIAGKACVTTTAAKIIEATRSQPTASGEFVDLRDLLPDSGAEVPAEERL